MCVLQLPSGGRWVQFVFTCWGYKAGPVSGLKSVSQFSTQWLFFWKKSCCVIVLHYLLHLHWSSWRSHITIYLSSSHWLPIRFRIHYKVFLVMYRALHGPAPEYFCDLIHPFIASKLLMSSDQSLMVFPQSWLKWDDSAFELVAPTLWSHCSLVCFFWSTV